MNLGLALILKKRGTMTYYSNLTKEQVVNILKIMAAVAEKTKLYESLKLALVSLVSIKVLHKVQQKHLLEELYKQKEKLKQQIRTEEMVGTIIMPYVIPKLSVWVDLAVAFFQKSYQLLKEAILSNPRDSIAFTSLMVWCYRETLRSLLFEIISVIKKNFQK